MEDVDNLREVNSIIIFNDFFDFLGASYFCSLFWDNIEVQKCESRSFNFENEYIKKLITSERLGFVFNLPV